jgi:hypothetical protein
MKKRMSKAERGKQRQAVVRKILLEAWDPIGVGQMPDKYEFARSCGFAE